MVDLYLPFVGDQNVQVVLDPMDSTVAHMEVVPMDLPLAHMEVDPMDITVAHMEVDQMDSTVAPGLDQTVDTIVGLDLPFVGDQNVDLDPTVALVVGLILLWQEYWQKGP